MIPSFNHSFNKYLLLFDICQALFCLRKETENRQTSSMLKESDDGTGSIGWWRFCIKLGVQFSLIRWYRKVLGNKWRGGHHAAFKRDLPDSGTGRCKCHETGTGLGPWLLLGLIYHGKFIVDQKELLSGRKVEDMAIVDTEPRSCQAL